MGRGRSVLSEPSKSPFPHLSFSLEASCLSSPVSISGHKGEATCSQGGSGCGMAQARKGMAQWLDLVAHAPPGGARLRVRPLLTPPVEELPLWSGVSVYSRCPPKQPGVPDHSSWGVPVAFQSRAHKVLAPPKNRLDPSWSLGRKGRAPAEGSFEVC